MATINNNRKCVICGTEYKYCSSCNGEDKDKPAWMSVFDTENCRKIYYICSNYEIGHYGSKEEAKEKLEKLDLSKKDQFCPVVKDWVEDIMSTPKKKKSVINAEG